MIICPNWGKGASDLHATYHVKQMDSLGQELANYSLSVKSAQAAYYGWSMS